MCVRGSVIDRLKRGGEPRGGEGAMVGGREEGRDGLSAVWDWGALHQSGAEAGL